MKAKLAPPSKRALEIKAQGERAEAIKVMMQYLDAACDNFSEAEKKEMVELQLRRQQLYDLEDKKGK